jgi:hypothetical protein
MERLRNFWASTLAINRSHLTHTTKIFLCVLRASVVNLILTFGCAHAFEDGAFDMVTMDYHADERHDVVFFGASAYMGLDRNLQEKISVQIISRNDGTDEPDFFWGVAASGRYRFGRPLSPFVGIGFSLSETPVCRETENDDDTVRATRDGEEICLDDTLFAAFGEYGFYWLIDGRVFLEISRRHNYTSKQEPFDSVVKGFSFGIRY